MKVAIMYVYLVSPVFARRSLIVQKSVKLAMKNFTPVNARNKLLMMKLYKKFNQQRTLFKEFVVYLTSVTHVL